MKKQSGNSDFYKFTACFFQGCKKFPGADQKEGSHPCSGKLHDTGDAVIRGNWVNVLDLRKTNPG
jgi:hypothetical protein